jgi:alpha-beta hydrolase superfamily lysophospholipase
VFKALSAAGCTVIAFDMHGHGRSEPAHDSSPHSRALIRSKEHLIEDAMLVLDTFVLPAARGGGVRHARSTDGVARAGGRQARARTVGGRDHDARARLPVFGVAHSLGSAVLTLVEKRRPSTFAVRCWCWLRCWCCCHDPGCMCTDPTLR